MKTHFMLLAATAFLAACKVGLELPPAPCSAAGAGMPAECVER